jgi:ankyrin repeat protein
VYFVFRFTPLHLASMAKNGSECIQILLHYDHANVDAKDHLQRTPIMNAIINGIDSNTIGTNNTNRDLKIFRSERKLVNSYMLLMCIDSER